MTIEVKVLSAAGTVANEYILQNVKSYQTSSGGYYYINTEEAQYYFPTDRTVLKITKNK